jgi:hypothetical protein
VDVNVLILPSFESIKNGIVFRLEQILIMYLIIVRVSFEIMTLDAGLVPCHVKAYDATIGTAYHYENKDSQLLNSVMSCFCIAH